MKKSIKNITLAAFLLTTMNANAISNRGFRSDMSFLDFDDITDKFNRKNKRNVHVIKNADCPVLIKRAEVKDKGTVFFAGLVGAQDTYTIDVQNVSGKNILAYEVTWILKHPFEDYIFHKITTNSISPLRISRRQELKFRKSKHYRDDVYYYVVISKVQFEDDESIWEAPDIDEYKRVGPIDEVKKEIDAMEDSQDLSNPDSINLDELKETLEKLESESLQTDDSGSKKKVELEEIKKEEIAPKEDLAPKEDPTPTIDKVIETLDTIYPDDSSKNLEKLELKPLQIDGSDVKNKIQDTVEEVKTTTTTTTETVIKKEEVKETEIVKEAPTADVIKETQVMKETQVLNKNQNSEDEDEFDFEDEEFDFDEDEEFEFNEEDEEF